MEIYIAASWKHQHAVVMLTKLLRQNDHEVRSFVENNFKEGHQPNPDKPFVFEDWIKTEEADRSFEYDTRAAMECNMTVYIGPSGKDAAAELGMTYACGKLIMGLWAKGEDFGLMRKMVHSWYDSVDLLIDAINTLDNIDRSKEVSQPMGLIVNTAHVEEDEMNRLENAIPGIDTSGDHFSGNKKYVQRKVQLKETVNYKPGALYIVSSRSIGKVVVNSESGKPFSYNEKDFKMRFVIPSESAIQNFLSPA